MTALFWQITLLLAAAYFIGTWSGCMARRVFFAHTLRSARTALPRTVEAAQPAPMPSAPIRRPDPGPIGALQSEPFAAPGTIAAETSARLERARTAPEPAAPAPSPVPVPPTAPVAAAPAAADDLTCIRAIDAALQSRLNQIGVMRFADIAAWRASDVKRISQALGFKGRIERENWIEQAFILAKNGQTFFSQRKAWNEEARAAPPQDEGDGPGAGPSAERAPASVPAAAGAAKPTPNGRDKLQRIRGIDADVEKLLNTQGVTRYGQIAGWTEADVARFDRLLGLAGRVARENWIEQAHILARGGETAYSREFDRRVKETPKAPAGETARPPKPAPVIAEAPPAKTAGEAAPTPRFDLSLLRSVRSEAFQGAEEPPASAAFAGPAGRRHVRAEGADDLKRIRGIGALIEKRLNDMGITTYAQIANWTGADIDRVSQVLDFKGRIERENWVEQARILSSGGQTDFSRRLDRSDPETSRKKVD